MPVVNVVPTSASLLVLAVALVLFAAGARAQTVLAVPSPAYPTIQSAIAAAQTNDLVQVAPGTYFESIDFLGKAITVLGAGPLLSIIDGSSGPGSVVTMNSGEAGGTVLAGFRIQGGTGNISASSSVPLGGGLCVEGAWPPVNFYTPDYGPYDPILILECHFESNAAELGGAVGAKGATTDLHFIACRFSQNSAINTYPSLGVFGQGGAILVQGRQLLLDDCVIENNVSGYAGGGVVFEGSVVEVRNTVIAGNTSPRNVAIWAGCNLTGLFERTSIVNNVATFVNTVTHTSLQGSAQYFSQIFWKDCLIADNDFVQGGSIVPAIARFKPNTSVINCTISAADVNASVAAVVATNTIFGSLTIFGPFTADHCNYPGAAPGSSNWDVPAGFVDAASGDYRLARGSAMIDAGDATVATPTSVDLLGAPRVRYGGLDIGAYEWEVAQDPAATGSLLDPALGTPVPVLEVGGSDGGIHRTVNVALGASWTLDFDSPDWFASAPHFAIFGALAAPTPTSITTLPLGGLEMAFSPCWMAPAFGDVLFVVASTFAGPSCAPLLPATPGDWSTGPIPGCPVPIDLSFQAVLFDAVFNPYVSNLLIVAIH